MKGNWDNSLYQPSARLSRFQLLCAVMKETTATQARLAELCGVSSGQINHYMYQLQREGLLEYERITRKLILYHVTAKGEGVVRDTRTELIKELVGKLNEARGVDRG